MPEITVDYLRLQGLSETFPERFWSKVQKTDSCWIWTGGKTLGYGYIGRGIDRNGLIRAHVASWFLCNGPIPKGKNILHRCDNPSCVRPDHLFIGTREDNVHDMMKKGRASVGERHYLHKLTFAQVQEIRQIWNEGQTTQRVIANRFHIRQGWVSCIVNRKAWKHNNGYY